MRQIRPALLALVALALVVTPVTTIAVASTDVSADGSITAANATDRTTAVIQSQSNATNFLDIEQEDVERGEYGESSLNVGAAVTMDVERLRGDYETDAFGARYANSSSDRRTAQVRAEVDRLEARIRTLEARQARAIADYNADDLSTEQFLQALATVDVAARQVEAQLKRLENRPDVLLTNDLEDRIGKLETDLIPLRGAVRARAGAAMDGDQSRASVYALTSRRGLVLSTMDGEQFHREAYIPANRDRTGDDNFITDDSPAGVNNANDRARALYPWTHENSGPSINPILPTSVYAVSLNHPHGMLDTHLDGATRNVFRELQTLQAERLPTESVTNTTASVVLQINRTYGTGPMKVTTIDPVTSEPLDAVVVVNGERVGQTGDDGQLWTPTPHRAVRIEVRSANGTAELRFFAG